MKKMDMMKLYFQKIKDDEINDTLRTFPKDKTVYLVFDCCHSGTIADLPYILTQNGVHTEKIVKNVTANVICIGGCLDNQTAADVNNLGVYYGALSQTLYTMLREYESKNRVVTWRVLYSELLSEMRKKRYVQISVFSASNVELFDSNVIF